MSDLRNTSTKSDRRAYGRLRSGLLYHKGEKSLFVTLTFPRSVECWVRARRTFDKWLEYLRRKYRLEYFRTATKEGNGAVFHICLIGSGEVPGIKEIRENWTRLSGATQLDVQWIRRTRAFYLEMTRQQKLARYSSSRGWLWPGASQTWKKICRQQIHWYKDAEGLVRLSWNQKTAVRRWQEEIQKARLARVALKGDV